MRNNDPKSKKSSHIKEIDLSDDNVRPVDVKVEISEAGFGPELPSELPVIPLNNLVVFPYVIFPLALSEEKYIKLINDALIGDRIVAFVTKLQSGDDTPTLDSFHSMGTAATILKMFQVNDGSIRLLLQGTTRIKLTKIKSNDPYIVSEITPISELNEEFSPRCIALMRAVKEQFKEIVTITPFLPEELKTVIDHVDDPGKMADLIGSSLNTDTELKQELLETLDAEDRGRIL